MLLLQKIAEVVGKHMNKESWITVVIYMYMASVLLALILWVYRFIAQVRLENEKPLLYFSF